jgi:hypothetical protein
LLTSDHSSTLETLYETKVVTAKYTADGDSFEVDFEKMLLTGTKSEPKHIKRSDQ